MNAPSSDRFRIIRPLGRGGMGVVYEAEDRDRGTRVALKTLIDVDPSRVVALKREFRSAADLSHPNLVTLYELVNERDQWLITMELVEGVHFLDYVRHGGKAPARKTAPGPIAFAQLGRLYDALQQLARGVHALHAAGKLHRDIKPANILVTPEGRVVLLDLGLAVALRGLRVLEDSEPDVAGTVAYMAPEQFAGLELAAPCDWYSVGATLHEALTGEIPFADAGVGSVLLKQQEDPPPPSKLVPGIPEDLDRLCAEMLRRDPQARPSGEEVLARLEAGTSGVESLSQPSLPDAPLVGRREQTQALRAAFEEVRGGASLFVHVHGLSGVGKSTLVERFLQDLVEHHEGTVLAGRCYEAESVPYKALDDLMDALARLLHRLATPEVVELLPDTAPALARLFPALKSVEAMVRAIEREPEVPDPQVLRRRAFHALRELLGALAKRQPVVLFVDDLQWGDTDSAALLDSLTSPPALSNVLFICCYRSEYRDHSSCLRALIGNGRHNGGGAVRRELAVDPLRPESSRELALALIGDDREEASALAERVAEEAGGNPYFVFALIESLREDRSLAERWGRGLNLDDVLWNRARRLPERVRRLLEVIAVNGRPIMQCDAYAASEVGEEKQHARSLLRTAHFARSTGPGDEEEIETYHDRIRETVIAHLEPASRRTHHHLLAATLEASGHVAPDALAFHFEGAGRPEEAGRYYAEAADQAADALAFQHAADLYRRSLELRKLDPEEEGRLRAKLGEALANAGRGLQAAQEFLAAAASTRSWERVELLRRAGFQYCISGHLDEGREVFRDVLAAVGMRLPGSPIRTLASLLLVRLLLRLRGLGYTPRDASDVQEDRLRRIDIARSVAVGLSISDPLGGAVFQTRGLLRALRAGEPLRVALSLAWEAAHASLAGAGGWRRTSRLLDKADELARQVQHPHALGLAALARGIAEFLAGNYEAGGVLSDGAVDILRDRCTGVAWEVNTASIFGHWALLYMGRLRALRTRFLAVYREALDRGNLHLGANLGTQIGAIALLVNDEEAQAREQLREILTLWTQAIFTVQHHNAILGEVYLDLYAGEGERASRLIESRVPDYRRALMFQIEHIRIDVTHLRGHAALAAADTASDPRPHLATASRSARRLQREKAPWGQALGKRLEAGVAVREAREDDAVRLLKEAIPALEAVQMGQYAAAARDRLGRLLGGDEGSACVAQARAWAETNGIRIPEKMLRTFGT